MAFDFSTLPKVRAYSHFGKLGNLNKLGACTWYTPWDCYTSPDVQAAKDELEAAHVVLLDLVNATAQFYQDAQTNNAPGDVISALGDDVQRGHALVQEHSNLMSAFYAETGTGVAGLKGLKGGNGLGFVVFGLAAAELAALLGSALRQIAIWYLVNKLGTNIAQAAGAFGENAKAAQEKFKRDGQYYMTWKDATEKGVTPPPQPDDSTAPGSTDWTTIAMIGGAIALLFMLGGKRR